MDGSSPHAQSPVAVPGAKYSHLLNSPEPGCIWLLPRNVNGLQVGDDVESLVSNAEPVCAALNIFRFMLLRESGSSKVNCKREEICIVPNIYVYADTNI